VATAMYKNDGLARRTTVSWPEALIWPTAQP